MKPGPRPKVSQLDLFQAQFEQLLNLDHPLCVLGKKIDWSLLENTLVDCCCPDTGAPAKAIRLLVGLHYLKHAFDESDESGQKVSVTTSNPGNWIVGVNLCLGNPCDGHTLAKAIATVA